MFASGCSCFHTCYIREKEALQIKCVPPHKTHGSAQLNCFWLCHHANKRCKHKNGFGLTVNSPGPIQYCCLGASGSNEFSHMDDVCDGLSDEHVCKPCGSRPANKSRIYVVFDCFPALFSPCQCLPVICVTLHRICCIRKSVLMHAPSEQCDKT